VNQANNSRLHRQGWEAYGTRVGYSMARAFLDFILWNFCFRLDPPPGSALFPRKSSQLPPRIKYSAVRIVVTRNDKGNDVFNSSGLLGPLAAEALSNSYLPRSEQTAREEPWSAMQRSRVAFRGKHIQGILADPLSRYAFAEGYAESRQPVAVASSLHFSM